MKIDERELTAARMDSVTPGTSSMPSSASCTRLSSSVGGDVAEAIATRYSSRLTGAGPT